MFQTGPLTLTHTLEGLESQLGQRPSNVHLVKPTLGLSRRVMEPGGVQSSEKLTKFCLWARQTKSELTLGIAFSHFTLANPLKANKETKEEKKSLSARIQEWPEAKVQRPKATGKASLITCWLLSRQGLFGLNLISPKRQSWRTFANYQYLKRCKVDCLAMLLNLLFGSLSLGIGVCNRYTSKSRNTNGWLHICIVMNTCQSRHVLDGDLFFFTIFPDGWWWWWSQSTT